MNRSCGEPTSAWRRTSSGEESWLVEFGLVVPLACTVHRLRRTVAMDVNPDQLAQDDLRGFNLHGLTDEDLDPSLLERLRVEQADAATMSRKLDNASTVAAGGNRQPRNPLRNAERAAMDHRRRTEQQRRELRTQGADLAEVDERGVRGAQSAPAPSMQFVEDASRRGDLEGMRAFRREGGIDVRKARISTSWVDNVAFSATIHSDSAPIVVARIKPRRYVSPANPPIAAALGTSRAPQERVASLAPGEEYAVFAYVFKTIDGSVYSSPTLKLNIDLSATFDRVFKDLSNDLMFRLDMERVHVVLSDNGVSGATVMLDRPRKLEIFKQALPLDAAPVATVTTDSARWTFRFNSDPNVRRWQLTMAEWWIRRARLQGIEADNESSYFRADVLVNGRLRDPSLVQVIATEDPLSNPLAPTVDLEIYPGIDPKTGRHMPIRRGDSLEFRVYATTRITIPQRKGVPKQLIGPSGGPAVREPETRWTLLSGASFEEQIDEDMATYLGDMNNELLKTAIPALGGLRHVFRTMRRAIVDGEAAEELDGGGARGVTAVDVEWRLTDEYDEFADASVVMALESLRVGPLSVAGLRQTVLANAR